MATISYNRFYNFNVHLYKKKPYIHNMHNCKKAIFFLNEIKISLLDCNQNKANPTVKKSLYLYIYARL